MKLVKGKKSVEYEIKNIPSDKIVNQKLLSLGIYQGAKISIKQFLPGNGPVIIVAGTGEVAISHEIASQIEVGNN